MRALLRPFAIILGVLFLASCGLNRKSSRPENAQEMNKTFYDFTAKTIEGKSIGMSKFKGKKILIVNTASKCGFTPQYEGLQKLHEQHGSEVIILGFPANEFGGQEPGADHEIASFCQKNYGVSFQMFSKVVVKGEGVHPIFSWLSDKNQNGWNETGPKWNFTKFLISEEGKLEKVFGSAIKPMSTEVLSAIQVKL